MHLIGSIKAVKAELARSFLPTFAWKLCSAGTGLWVNQELRYSPVESIG